LVGELEVAKDLKRPRQELAVVIVDIDFDK